MGDSSRLRWKGLLWEGDSTQLYYVRARWYDPAMRRFVSEDPVGLAGGINLYLYGSGDPVNMIDPSGLDGDVVTCTYSNANGETITVWGTCEETKADCYQKSIEACTSAHDAVFVGSWRIDEWWSGNKRHSAILISKDGRLRITELVGPWESWFNRIHIGPNPFYGMQSVERYSWVQIGGADRIDDMERGIRAAFYEYRGDLYSVSSNFFVSYALSVAGLHLSSNEANLLNAPGICYYNTCRRHTHQNTYYR